MMIDSGYRLSRPTLLAVPDDHRTRARTLSWSDHESTAEKSNASINLEPSVAIISPSALPMPKAIRSIKTFKRTWDPDKALRSTHEGHFDKYQLRAYLFVMLGYAVIAAWLTAMPIFALLPPKDLDCTQHDRLNLSNATRNADPVYNYSDVYGRSALSDFKVLCSDVRIKIPHIIVLIGLILGALISGCAADYSGRKMILLGSLWTSCVLSIFQLLSEDYISYAFFMLFLGIAMGAVHVISVPYVMEMFPIEFRAIAGLLLLGSVFLLDLVIPWLAVAIRNWKILQAVVTIPLILTAPLYWFSEESMFWYTAQKDYAAAILSLIKIGRFNGVSFEEVFREARSFLHGKRSKGVQCDLQPPVRLEDMRLLSVKYTDFDAVDLKAFINQKSLFQRIAEVLAGHHYYPTLSTFYPSDFLHSPILMVYLLLISTLWLVNSLTEYSLDSPHLTTHLTGHFLHDYFYTCLIQIISFLIAAPLVHLWGRRWPTFCFFLLAEICLLGSVAVKLDDEQTRSGVLVIYFVGKFAARAAFLVIFIYTCEIFPTGLRCTTVGICCTCRLIGIILASPNVGELNDWMPRLIYGILSLIIGALALLLPETKKASLPRTMIQVELLPTSISQNFRRRRLQFIRRKNVNDGISPNAISSHHDDVGAIALDPRSPPPISYDYQSTVNSVYVLEDLRGDETIQSLTNRPIPRRIEPRTTILNPMFIGVNPESARPASVIAEDTEYEDEDADGTRIPLKPYRTAPEKTEEIILVPVTQLQTIDDQSSTVEVSSRTDGSVAIPLDKVTNDDDKMTQPSSDDVLSRSPRYRRTMSQDENYFSEHS